jgi:hypothetical protein
MTIIAPVIRARTRVDPIVSNNPSEVDFFIPFIALNKYGIEMKQINE